MKPVSKIRTLSSKSRYTPEEIDEMDIRPSRSDNQQPKLFSLAWHIANRTPEETAAAEKFKAEVLAKHDFDSMHPDDFAKLALTEEERDVAVWAVLKQAPAFKERGQAIVRGDLVSKADKRKVFNEEMPCPTCGGSTNVTIQELRFPGRLRDESYVCWCYHFAVYNELRKKLVPVKFQHMKWLGHKEVGGTIKPYSGGRCTGDVDFQRMVIDCIENHPDEGYIFIGPAGVGKTSLETALFHRALAVEVLHHRRTSLTGKDAIHARSISTTELLKQHREYVTKSLDGDVDVPEPHISVGWIAKTDHPRVFLGEFEKIGKMTEFRYENLFGIVNAMYEKLSNCQLVIDTNLRWPGEFEAEFTDKISSRISSMCWKIDYFKSEITAPLE
jgi:hypothetical protein